MLIFALLEVIVNILGVVPSNDEAQYLAFFYQIGKTAHGV